MAYQPIIYGVTSALGTNSTITNLAAGATFTGQAEDVSKFSSIKVIVHSSHASALNGLTLQESHNGIDWFSPTTGNPYSIPATTLKTFSVGKGMDFFRVVYVNSGTLTISFMLITSYNTGYRQASSVRPQDGRGNDNDMEEMLCHLMGFNLTADAWNRVGITSGSLGGNENLLDRLKVNASLRMIDNAQPSGSKLVGVTGSQTLGMDVNTGTDITTPTAMPAGGLGMRGWLSAIWTKLNGVLDISDRSGRLLGIISAGTNKIGSVDIAGSVAITSATAAALNADLIVSTDVSAFKSVTIQYIGTWVGTFQAQGSNDNVTFIPVVTENLGSSGVSLSTQNTLSNVLIHIPVKFKFLRVRMTAFTSGSATASAIGYTDDRQVNNSNFSISSGSSVGLNVSTTNIGGVMQRGTNLNGNTMSALNAAAGTNATLLKATAATLYTVTVMNTSAANRYVRIYNLTVAPTVGTSIPIVVIAVPTLSSKELQFGVGMPFSTGLSYSVTGGAAATDATAVTAGDVQLAISWN